MKYRDKRPLSKSTDYSPMKMGKASFDNSKFKHPIVTKTNEKPPFSGCPITGYATGNVHMSTFDGTEYPLRGYGEYILLRSKDGSLAPVMIQLRTDDSPLQSSDSSKAVIVRYIQLMM